MQKLKKTSEEPKDRLSELPDSIIFEIFGLLSMRDVVRTTFLSKRWNNLWTTTPYLNFDDPVDYNNHRAQEFVNRALIAWRGLKILKFKFNRGSANFVCPDFSDFDEWMDLAMENGIEELYLQLYPLDNEYGVYVVPDNLYSCASLKVLSLKGCEFGDHEDVQYVQWNKLKSLTMVGYSLNQDLIDKVISGSPELEAFILDLWGNLWENDESLSIRSSSLKELSIERDLECEPTSDSMREEWLLDFGGEPLTTDSELIPWSPNLKTLHLRGVAYAKYSLLDVSSLIHLTLDIHFNIDEADYAGEILWHIFPTIQHVEKLTLSRHCIKGLIYMKEKHLLSPLSNFKFLTITTVEEYKDILDLLPIFPKLETLVLQIECSWRFDNNADRLLQVERNLPKTFLLQLRTVELISYEDSSVIYTFIEILLKRAIKLQKLVFRNKQFKLLTPEMALHKLLKMPRSSPTAELIVAA